MIIATPKWKQSVMSVGGTSLIRPSSSKSFTPAQEEWLIARGYAVAVNPDQIITSLPETQESINASGEGSLEDEQEGENEQGNEPETAKPKRTRKP